MPSKVITNEDIAQSWINYYLNGDEADFWATEDLLGIVFDDFRRGWIIVNLINSVKIDDENWQDFIDSNVAAGPLEDLIANYGEELIDTIEKEAKSNKKLRRQLGMIYQRKTSEEVWKRIQSLAVTTTD